MDQNNRLTFAAIGIAGVSLLLTIFLFVKQNDLEKRGSKIGYIKSELILTQYKPAMAIKQKLDEELTDVKADLEKRGRELEAMGSDLEKKSKVLSNAALAPQMEVFQRKQNEYYQLQQAAQQSVNQKQAQLLEPIFQDISTFINKYGKDNGYTVILGSPVEGIVVYGDAGHDLTDIIVNELNSKVPPSMPVPFNSTKDSTKK